MFGPVGPLETPGSRWPQWPRYVSHASGPSAAGNVETTIGVGVDPERRPARVVAAEPGALLAVPEVQGRAELARVRAGGHVDDRVASLLLDLGVGPGMPLPACVLGVGDLRGLEPERLVGRVGREGELDHLPVALVLVVELVEEVVEPVLEGDSTHAGLVGDVGVDDRPATAHESLRLPRVRAARPARMARRGRGSSRPPSPAMSAAVGPWARTRVCSKRAPRRRPHEPDSRVAEGDLDGRGPVLLAGPGAGRVRVLLQHHDRRVAPGELALGGALGAGKGGRRQDGERRGDDEHPSAESRHAAGSMPRGTRIRRMIRTWPAS